MSDYQLKPGIVINNLYLGIEGTKTNINNIKEYILKLQGRDKQNNHEFDELEKELMNQVPGGWLLQHTFILFHLYKCTV